MMAEVSRAASEPQIAALVARSFTSFKALTSTLQDDHARASQASSCLARFKLWAGNLGAHRPSGSRSLEYRLRDASNIRKVVISLLQDLCSSIEQGTLVAKGGSIPDTTSEDHDTLEDDLADYFNEDGDSDKSEVEQTLDEIAHVVDCLLRLSVTIRNPAPHDQFLSRAGEGLVKEFVHWDTKHVRDKFPNVDKDLAGRLGRAMARRRQYFKYREEHKSRLAEGLDGDEVDFDFGGRATTIASSLPEHLREAGKSTEAGVTQFARLDDARSDASATSYATSRPDSTQLRVPPIPKEHIDGSFKCPFCHMIVSIDTRHAWKKHVFRDLRPYVCLAEACQTPDHLYQRRNDWKMHMRREHWKAWHCHFGCDGEFDSAKGFQDHVKTAHEQNVSLEKIHALAGLSSRTDVAKAKVQCPLCYDFQVGSEKQYEKHVGQHLEHLALFTLPNTGEGGSEDEGDEDMEEEELSDGDEGDEDNDEEEEEEALSMTNLDEEANKDVKKKFAQKLEEPNEMIHKDWSRGGSKKDGKGLEEVHMASESAAPEEEDGWDFWGISKMDRAKKKGILEDAGSSHPESPPDLQDDLWGPWSRKKPPLTIPTPAPDPPSFEDKNEGDDFWKRTASPEESEKNKEAVIRFKDAVGRKFSLPFHLYATWRTMEDFIKQAFQFVDVLEPHVLEGHYDLIGPGGEIILPSVWEKVIQPDWTITMTMWPVADPLRDPGRTQPAQSPPLGLGKGDPEKIRLEAEIAAFKSMEERQKAEEKRMEVEAQIRKEAEEAFNRRMEDMRIAQEEAKKEIKEARIEAEKAARERLEAERKAEEERAQKHAEAMATAEKKARLLFEAQMKVGEERMKEMEEEEERATGEELGRIRFEKACFEGEVARLRAAEAKRIEEKQDGDRAE